MKLSDLSTLVVPTNILESDILLAFFAYTASGIKSPIPTILKGFSPTERSSRCIIVNNSLLTPSIKDKNWLDAFVDAKPEKIKIRLLDSSSKVVYECEGKIPFGKEMTYAQITSTGENTNQYEFSLHTRRITLSNGDTLTICGKNAMNYSYNGSLGNGYAIISMVQVGRLEIIFD